MSYYLVSARPRPNLMRELHLRLEQGEIRPMRPFGGALDGALREARIDPATGLAAWEEEDYCSPPLAQERAAVLDQYFDELSWEPVEAGQGWRRIGALPPLWPEVPGPS